MKFSKHLKPYQHRISTVSAPYQQAFKEYKISNFFTNSNSPSKMNKIRPEIIPNYALEPIF